jgi:hypothetical protein
MKMFSKSVSGTLIGMVAFLLMTGVGADESMQDDAWQQEPQQGAHAEMQQIEERLFEIQQLALDANPELREQLDNLGTLAKGAMIDAGYDPDAYIKKLQSAQITLQDETLPEEERMQVLEEAQQAQQGLQEAEHVAMQDEAVAEAHSAYRMNLMAAMREEAPEVDQLVERFQQIQQGR